MIKLKQKISKKCQVVSIILGQKNTHSLALMWPNLPEEIFLLIFFIKICVFFCFIYIKKNQLARTSRLVIELKTA